MKLLRLIPTLAGAAVLVFGLHLVSTNGYVGGTHLPSLVGIQPCMSNTGSNGTGCSGFSPYGGYGVGTIMRIFGLGPLTSSLRRAVATLGSGTSPGSSEMIAALTHAQTRIQTAPGTLVPGAKLGTVYCPNCGAANPTGAKFCHQCATPMPAVAAGGPSSTPSAPPPGASL